VGRRRSARGLGGAWSLLLAAASVLVVLAAASVTASEAEKPPAQAGRSTAEQPAPVALDQLLRLPADRQYGIERRGGLTKWEWRAIFQEVRHKLAAERKALAEATQALEGVAEHSPAWQIGPAVPGMQRSADAPLDYQLQRRIKRHRAEIKRLEARLRGLTTDANLAGVPEEWRS